MENKKEELKKLESQYNKYMKIIKVILLIILFVALIFATRFIYCFSLANKILHANYIDILSKNYKKTYFTTFNDSPTEDSSITYYYKDGVTVMEASFFKSYSIDGKIYDFYPNSDEKKYSVHEYVESDKWEDFNFPRKIATIAVYASTFYTCDIGHEELNGEKCIVFKDENNKVYYNAETFLQVRDDNSNSITDITYEFDVVTDEDIKLPDLSEYVLDED